METRVYLIDMNRFDYDLEETDIHSWTDERWVRESETQGLTFSLKKFELAFNEEDFSMGCCFMRIITPKPTKSEQTLMDKTMEKFDVPQE